MLCVCVLWCVVFMHECWYVHEWYVCCVCVCVVCGMQCRCGVCGSVWAVFVGCTIGARNVWCVVCGGECRWCGMGEYMVYVCVCGMCVMCVWVWYVWCMYGYVVCV